MARVNLRSLSRVIRDVRRETKEAQLFITAASLAYTTILSIVPLLALSLAIFKAFGGMDRLYDVLEPIILSNLTEGTSQEVTLRLRGFIDNVHGTSIGAGGFIGLVVTSLCLLISVENSFNRIWRVKTARGWFQRIASYGLFITLGPLSLSVVLGIASSSNLAVGRLFPGSTLIYLIVTALLILAYKVVPNTRVDWKYALLPGLATGILWVVTRLGYGFYIAHFAAYNRIYGSVAAIPIVLFWIYLLWLLILSGAALSAALQQRFGSNAPDGQRPVDQQVR